MIGLYLLTTEQLIKDKTIKFGMSMRLEYRWIDYLAILVILNMFIIMNF